MALDGITIAALTKELSDRLVGGRIYKIAQPEADELLLTFKTGDGQKRLKLTANASLPYAALTEENKPSPMTAPNFCMLLRKHLQNGRLLSVRQPGLERVIELEIEHLNEMGDLCRKTLLIELMGKHSNIILLNEDRVILDSIKHISAMVSSVREVLPGKPYFIPFTEDKLDPLGELSFNDFCDALQKKNGNAAQALYQSFDGISPVMANEILYRAGADPDLPSLEYPEALLHRLYECFTELMDDIDQREFFPNIIYDGAKPVEYSAVELTIYRDMLCKPFSSISEVLNTYYSERDIYTRLRQRSADLRHIVQTCLERNAKKLDLQAKQLKDTDKMEKYRLYGELINTYGYGTKPGEKVLSAVDYRTNEEVKVPLDPTLSPRENAKKYFDRYSKLKRTKDAVTVQLEETKAEVEHLSSVMTSLELAGDETTLSQIREELVEAGYIKKGRAEGDKKRTGKGLEKSQPYHYLSSDGFDIYVGKNNFQNDYLTFHLAGPSDWWFHAKKIPGSHVILKAGGKELPDRAFEEAGALAAYYSKGRDQNKVEIDYVEKKQIKKPAAAKPGFVIYYTNYSLTASPDISGLKLIAE
ncbi:MAG: NFACT family protein [Lachnospiraceae bacterium]|nr:NFACT family protein [Lachnospiraceae bacterium]